METVREIAIKDWLDEDNLLIDEDNLLVDEDNLQDSSPDW